MNKKQLLIISGNNKKIAQLGQILSQKYVFKQENIDLPQIQGDIQQIAKEKVKSAFNKIKKPVLIQDTSLCFNAFKGLPGPYIKYFWSSIGCQGLSKMLDSFEDKTAVAISIIGYMDQNLQQPILFIGETFGKIVRPRGNLDLGWEPIFQHNGYDETYAQMNKQIKNKISYRSISIRKMENYLENIDAIQKNKNEQT